MFVLKNFLKIIPFLLIIILASCAKRGSISGGLKDTIAPVLKISEPKNYTTNFTGNSIKLTFNEYVKLKNIGKQLIVSPPMTTAPIILPSTASKYISINIKDTLQPNTTYSFNFGQSIEDNNEGNPYKQFKYVFSTGNYLDSLKLSGKIKDAFNKKTENFVSVMLYELNEKNNDSIVYNQKPRYITNTLDSATTFQLENIKAGKYLLVALKDENSNLKFDPKNEKIGFHKQLISIPNDTLYEIELFKEKPIFKTLKPTQVSNDRIVIGYTGNYNGAAISLKKGNEIVPSVVTKMQDKDSVQVWFNRSDLDSVKISIEKDKYLADYNLKLKKQKIDTLSIILKQNGILNFRDTLVIKTSIPITKIDNSKIFLINKDSTNVKFETQNNLWKQEIEFKFEKEPLQKYKLKILPGAFVDFFEKENDSLQFSIATKNISDYGNLRLKLENAKSFPIIVELLNKDGKVLYTEYAEKTGLLNFDLIEPSLFTLRIIYDENKNKEWDSGNFISKKQSEEVIYFPKEIDIRANWDVEQVFDLK